MPNKLLENLWDTSYRGSTVPTNLSEQLLYPIPFFKADGSAQLRISKEGLTLTVTVSIGPDR